MDILMDISMIIAINYYKQLSCVQYTYNIDTDVGK